MNSFYYNKVQKGQGTISDKPSKRHSIISLVFSGRNEHYWIV
jgi:hypothetical protein